MSCPPCTKDCQQGRACPTKGIIEVEDYWRERQFTDPNTSAMVWFLACVALGLVSLSCVVAMIFGG